MKPPSEYKFWDDLGSKWRFWCGLKKYANDRLGKEIDSPVKDAVRICTSAFDCVSDFFEPESVLVTVKWYPREIESDDETDRTGCSGEEPISEAVSQELNRIVDSDEILMSVDAFRELDTQTLQEMCGRDGLHPAIGQVDQRVTTTRVYTEHGFSDLRYERDLGYDIDAGGSERTSGYSHHPEPVLLTVGFSVNYGGWYGTPNEDDQIYVWFTSRIETCEALAGSERLCEINRWRELSGVECLFDRFCSPDSYYNDTDIEDIDDPVIPPPPPYGNAAKPVVPPFDGPDPEALIQQDRLQWAETAFADAEVVDSADGERLSVWVDEPEMTDAELRARVETYVADRLDDGENLRLARLRVERASGATLDAAITDDGLVWSR